MSGLRRGFPTAALSRLVIAVLTAGVYGCGDVMGGDLAIQGTASAFQVAIPEPFPGTRFQLKVAVINFSTDAAGGNIDDFEIACEIFVSDALGVSRFPLVTQTVGDLAVDAFDVTEIVFPTFTWMVGSETSGHFFIACEADPNNLVEELDEGNNTFTFLFRAYCLGGSDPCPGPIQQGPSLPHTAPATPNP